MGKFKKLFGFDSTPDYSAIRAQEKRLKEQEEKLAAEEAARKAEEEKKKKAALSARKGRSGGTSLLTGLETGVSPEDEKRGSLG
jgi:hypothetical protein